MTRWLPHSLPVPPFSVLTAVGVLHGNVLTFLSWTAKLSCRADIFYLLYRLLFLFFLDKRTQESSCSLALFFTFQTPTFFL